MHSLDMVPDAHLEKAAVLTLPASYLVKANPNYKREAAGAVSATGFSAMEIMACSTSACHEGFKLFSLVRWARGLLTAAEDAESKCSASQKKKRSAVGIFHHK